MRDRIGLHAAVYIDPWIHGSIQFRRDPAFPEGNRGRFPFERAVDYRFDLEEHAGIVALVRPDASLKAVFAA